MKKELWFLILFVLCSLRNLHAQTADIDSVKNELYRINKQFDTAENLMFNVNIDYKSDTVLGRFDSEAMTAEYALNKQNIYYRVGPTEYMQNDSVSICIANDQHLIMASKESIQTSNLFPLKNLVDSTLAFYDSSFQITINYDADSNKIIQFISDSINVPFSKMVISYDPESYMLTKIEMAYTELSAPNELQQSVFDDSLKYTQSDQPGGNPDADSLGITLPVVKRMTMMFNNYKFMNNLSVFQIDQYILFDRIRNEYSASGKYAGYKLISSNLGNTTSQYEDIETPGPADIESDR